jgi:transposase-like protein
VPIVTQLQRTLLASDPLIALRELRALRAELDAFEREQVRFALESGASFASVARGLGITRQAAHRRYRNLLDGEASPRLLASADALALLQRARRVAAEDSAAYVEPGHVLRALSTPLCSGPLTGHAPASLEPALFESLARIGGVIGVDELARAAQALLGTDIPDAMTRR